MTGVMGEVNLTKVRSRFRSLIAERDRLRVAVEDAYQWALLTPSDPSPDYHALAERMKEAMNDGAA